MRSKMTLRDELAAMERFRATMTNPEKFRRYLRVDSESLSMLLAKVAVTTCYGIPVKGEPGYISEDDDDETAGIAKRRDMKRSAVGPI